MSQNSASRRTGVLVLQPQILLEDLVRGLPAAVRAEITNRIAPLLPKPGVPTTAATDLAQALLEFPTLDGYPGAESRGHHAFLGPYLALDISQATRRAVVRLRGRGDAESAVLFDPEFGGGGDWILDDGEWLYKPLSQEPNVEVLRPFGRTLGARLELTSGTLSQCVPPAFGQNPIEPSEGIRRLCEHLEASIRLKIGGAEYLENIGLENGCLTILATSIGAFLAHPSLQRSRGSRHFVRGDLYLRVLSELVPMDLQDVARRLLERGHPRHIPLKIHWPLMEEEPERGPLHLLELHKGHLVLRPGLQNLLEGSGSTRVENESVQSLPVNSSHRSNYDEEILDEAGEEIKRDADYFLSLTPSEDLLFQVERALASRPLKNLDRSNYGTGFLGNVLGNDPETHESNPDTIPVALLGWERHPSDRDLAEVRTAFTPEMVENVFHEHLKATQFGILYREIQLNDWARLWGEKQVGPLARKWTKGWRSPHNKSLFAKYKDAAAKLEAHFPWLYSRFLTAVIENQPLPSLPPASRLCSMPKMTRGLDPEQKALVSKQLLISGGSSRIFEFVHHEENYGSLPQELIPDIKQIEQLSDVLARSTEVVHRISVYNGATEIRDQVARRFRVLARRLDELRALLPVAGPESGSTNQA